MESKAFGTILLLIIWLANPFSDQRKAILHMANVELAR
jgi:hypothetical protein